MAAIGAGTCTVTGATTVGAGTAAAVLVVEAVIAGTGVATDAGADGTDSVNPDTEGATDASDVGSGATVSPLATVSNVGFFTTLPPALLLSSSIVRFNVASSSCLELDTAGLTGVDNLSAGLLIDSGTGVAVLDVLLTTLGVAIGVLVEAGLGGVA